MKAWRFFVSYFWLIVLSWPWSFASASLYVPSVPNAPINAPAITLNIIYDLINGVARFVMVTSIIVAIIFIVWGGVLWTAARDNQELAGKAKKTITNGIWGALIILGIGVILRTVAALVTRRFFYPFNF